MSVTQQIKEDYGTVARFAELHDVRTQSVYAAISGRPEYTTAVNILIEKGYIQHADDLRKVAR